MNDGKLQEFENQINQNIEKIKEMEKLLESKKDRIPEQQFVARREK